MRLTKENILSIEEFIKDSVKRLTTSDFTCSKYDLDEDLAIFVGWLGGYDENDNDCIHDEKEKNYCLNVGIKIRNDYDWSDYIYLNSPIFNDDSGEIYDTDISISVKEDYRRLARYLIKNYNNIKRLLKTHKLSIDF